MLSLMSASHICERLGVGVRGDELDAAQACVDHAVDGVGSAAADADDLDDREVAAAALHDGFCPTFSRNSGFGSIQVADPPRFATLCRQSRPVNEDLPVSQRSLQNAPSLDQLPEHCLSVGHQASPRGRGLISRLVPFRFGAAARRLRLRRLRRSPAARLLSPDAASSVRSAAAICARGLPAVAAGELRGQRRDRRCALADLSLRAPRFGFREAGARREAGGRRVRASARRRRSPRRSSGRRARARAPATWRAGGSRRRSRRAGRCASRPSARARSKYALLDERGEGRRRGAEHGERLQHQRVLRRGRRSAGATSSATVGSEPVETLGRARPVGADRDPRRRRRAARRPAGARRRRSASRAGSRMGRHRADQREARDRGRQRRLVGVERGHAAGGFVERALDRVRLRPVRTGHADVLDGDERGVAQPQQAAAEQRQRDERADQRDAQPPAGAQRGERRDAGRRADARARRRPPGGGAAGAAKASSRCAAAKLRSTGPSSTPRRHPLSAIARESARRRASAPRARARRRSARARAGGPRPSARPRRRWSRRRCSRRSSRASARSARRRRASPLQPACDEQHARRCGPRRAGRRGS